MKHAKKMLGLGMTNLVGIGMIGATSSMINDLPAGTSKTLVGNIPGLQGISLLGMNLKGTKGIW